MKNTIEYYKTEGRNYLSQNHTALLSGRGSACQICSAAGSAGAFCFFRSGSNPGSLSFHNGFLGQNGGDPSARPGSWP
jgi:hypothetical protein